MKRDKIGNWNYLRVCIFILGTFVFLHGCKQPAAGLIFQKDIHLSFPEMHQNIWSYSSCIYSNSGNEYIAYASAKVKELHLINIKTNKSEYIIPLNKIVSLVDFTFNPLKFYIHNLDSIFILPDEAKTVYLIDRNGELINEWDINTDKNSSVLSGFNSSPFSFHNNKLYIRLVPKIDPFAQKANYFSINPEIIIDIKNGNKISRAGGWAAKYLKENYYDDYPFLDIKENGNQDELIYSYAAEHDIYIYHRDSVILKKSAKSIYINKFVLFSDDSIGNISYTMRYLITAPKYGMVLYDKYRNLFYRLAFHQTEYVNSDGNTVKRSMDQPWSLIILDGNCEKVNEINIDQSKYICGPIYVVKEGLMIPKRRDQNLIIKNEYDWSFDILKIE